MQIKRKKNYASILLSLNQNVVLNFFLHLCMLLWMSQSLYKDISTKHGFKKYLSIHRISFLYGNIVYTSFKVPLFASLFPK